MSNQFLTAQEIARASLPVLQESSATAAIA